MGWLIALSILTLLAVMPLGVCVCYDCAGLVVKIVAGFLRVQVVPSGKNPGKKAKKENSDKPNAGGEKKVRKTQAENKTKTEMPSEKKGGSLLDFMPLVQLALEFFGTFVRKLRINKLELCLVLAGDDPCDLAANYGKTCAALGNLWPRLEEIFVIRKRDVKIQCDFEASQTLVTAHLSISITLGRLLCVLVCYAVRALVQYIKITDKRKGGAAV